MSEPLLPKGARAYLVGGAVRDLLLGRPVQDRDWVVVGASPEGMRALGYTPVGRDFPVFLHPHTKEEYALARTERQSGRGYHGFTIYCAPDVTLEQDLGRRDLTINSIAIDPYDTRADGDFSSMKIDLGSGAPVDGFRVLDPHQGRADLRQRVLRHVSAAFREDPVRILRLARFAARFPDFCVAPTTTALMTTMVQDGEMEHLVPERVWQELARGLMEACPSRMLEVLRLCGALHALMPEVDRLWGVPQRADYHPEVDTGAHLQLVLDMAATLQAPLGVRYACLVHDLGKGTTPAALLPRHHGHEARSARLAQALSQRLRVPLECRELADVMAREHGNIHRSSALTPDALLRLLERCDALRKPQRFAQLLLACECDARGRAGLQDQAYPVAARLAQALAVVRAVPTDPIAQRAMADGVRGAEIGQRIHQARVQALANAGV